jgi:hypothetical protein
VGGYCGVLVDKPRKIAAIEYERVSESSKTEVKSRKMNARYPSSVVALSLDVSLPSVPEPMCGPARRKN